MEDIRVDMEFHLLTVLLKSQAATAHLLSQHLLSLPLPRPTEPLLRPMEHLPRPMAHLRGHLPLMESLINNLNVMPFIFSGAQTILRS